MNDKSKNPTIGKPKKDKSIQPIEERNLEQKTIKEELKTSEEETDRLVKENEMLINAAKQALADFQNYKRRVEEQQKYISTFAIESLIMELLPFIDNLERAIKAIPDDSKVQDWANGMKQVHQQLIQLLENKGLKTIKTTGEKLDPAKHEALMQAPGEKDIILEELEKGYILGEKVIRAAKVKVGNGS